VKAATALAPSTVTLPAADLRTMLRVVSPFISLEIGCGTEDLDAVCLNVRDGKLIASASNRYTFVEYSVPAAGDFDRKKILIAGPAAKTSLQLLGRPGKDALATITVDGDAVRMAVPGMEWSLPHAAGRSIVVDRWIDDAPGLQQKLAKPVAPVTEMGISPTLAAKFGAVARVLNEYQSTWTFKGPKEPVTIRIGDRFTGWLMPIKLYPPKDATS